MSVIFCPVEMFAYDQTVYEIKDGAYRQIAKIPLNELGKFIPKYCNAENIEEVHLIGSTAFTQDIKEKIEKTNSTKYNNSVNIKVYLDEEKNFNE